MTTATISTLSFYAIVTIVDRPFMLIISEVPVWTYCYPGKTFEKAYNVSWLRHVFSFIIIEVRYDRCSVLVLHVCTVHLPF